MAVVKENTVMFTVADVASILNVHVNTIRRWSNEGRIKSYRVGVRGDRCFTPADLKDFIDSSLVAPLDFYANSVAEDGTTSLQLSSIE